MAVGVSVVRVEHRRVIFTGLPRLREPWAVALLRGVAVAEVEVDNRRRCDATQILVPLLYTCRVSYS